MRRTQLPAGVLLIAAAVLAGCVGAMDVPFEVRATETVWCADSSGVVGTVTWQGHDGPLTDLDVKVVPLAAGAVSEDDLLDACARPWPLPTRATLCEAYAPAEQVDQHAASGFVTERHGATGPDRPGFPVVVRGRVSCEELQLDAGPAAAVAEASGFPIADRLRDWHGTDRFNSWRDHDRVLREAADGGCLDIAVAREHALAAQDELEGDWPVLETARDPEARVHAGLCMDVRLQREGFIEVDYHAVVTPGERWGLVDEVRDASEPDRPTGR